MATLPTDADTTPNYTAANHATHHNTIHGLWNVLTTAGDLIVATGAQAYSRLAMGSALQVLRVNAAGTALEYAAPSGTEVWADYTPSNTNITVGNGTQIARYCQNGKSVLVRYSLTWGSTTSFGGAIEIGLPVAAATTGLQAVLNGNVYGLDSGTAEKFGMSTRGVLGSATKIAVLRDSDGSGINATIPHTWAVNDVLTVSLFYEAA